MREKPTTPSALFTPLLPVTSLVAMNNLKDVFDFLAEVGDETRFELSYTMTPALLNAIETTVKGKVVSVHACCPATEYFPNLASGDSFVIAQSFKDMRSTLDTAVRFGASIVALHAGYVTDLAMPSDYKVRSLLLAREEFNAEVRFKEGSICGPDYNRGPKYLLYATRAKEHLAELAAEYAVRGILLAVENLNPRVGYLFHTPEEMVKLAWLHPNLAICLDVGHLRISSFAYGFNFLEGVRKIVSTGKVATCHLHSNSSAPERFKDDHHSIDMHDFPIKEVLAILANSGANLVLETVEEPLRNYRMLRKMLD
jgi:sugar phosphate isomerase/epimerase